MAILRTTRLQPLCAWLLALTQVFCVLGCRQSTGSGKGGAGSTAAGASAGLNLGEIAYQILHHQYDTAGETGKAAALERRKDDFVSSINRILPPQTGQNLFPTLLGFLPLVDDGSVEAAVTDMDGMMTDMLADQAAMEGLARMLGGSSSGAVSDGRSTNLLISRLLAYPELESLSRAILELLRDHDGLDAAGNPNPAEKDYLGGLQALLSRQLLAYQPAPGAGQQLSSTLQKLRDGLLTSEPLAAWPDLGAPAFAVRLDVHGNPRVLADAGTGRLPVPFVDADGDGAADVGQDGRPVDAAGNPIDLPPFGSDGTRDSYGRALVTGGALYYDYFDLKRTMLSELLLLTGELLKKDLPGPAVKVLSSLTDRVRNDNGTPDTADDYDTLAPDSPILDLVHANMELVKSTPLPDLLKGIAAVIKADPAKFSDLVDTLLVSIKKANAAAATVPAAPPPAGGSQQLLNDLLPLLETLVQPRNGTSTVRALLQAFNSEQRRLGTLPRSFALMVRWSDYGRRIPTSATAPSVMQRLLQMMERANGCTVIGASGSGNMAEFYLDAMAGNARILGFNISIGTINQLVDISIIRNLLCSAIRPEDVRALKDFNDTGALEAMKPIAKVFSDRGQTRILKDVMLGLGRHYDAAMKPGEPTLAAILESGAVEKLFTVIDAFTQVRVPGSTEVVADVLADTLQAVIQARNVVDRRGVTHRSLLKLMLTPMDALSQRAQARGVKAELDTIMSALGDVLLATYVDNKGTADPADDVERWKWGSLKAHLAGTLELVADAIPAAPADRATWAQNQLTTIQDLLTGRDTVFVLDLVTEIGLSPQKQAINAGIANLVTPRPSAAEDAFGGILILVSELLGKKQAQASSIDEQALADVLHFVGRQLDPAAQKMRGIGRLAMKLIAADDGLFLLHVARNAFDMGPNGTDKPPIAILQEVMNEVGAAGASGGPMDAARLRTVIQGMLDFMQDQKSGLPTFIARIKNRPNR